ncbi:polysaccharide deacetylase family protein [Govanella unica]|uniref:Polysaccharide deacetylase family protein n=1 Tax=Govanella unica TaxID=2975056 RepID=A0A9X3TY95_9PROT|nr:polysaccharide deacetylase family protein [Govania unica]MDA5194196.1 polysaccharide deacetylase family protein [Govania unica]
MKRLLVSIHDVAPSHFARLERIVPFLEETNGIGTRYSMLVVPDFWRKGHLRDDPAFCAWLRARAAAGVEMILHGYYHRDETPHTSWGQSLKASALTAREGEFLGLSRAEALARMQQGKAELEDILGQAVKGFIAPAWLYSAGTKDALKDANMMFAEDHWRVWLPGQDRVVAKGPVISYASRSKSRIASSLLWSRLATTLLRPLDTVRLAVHPHDFDIPSLITETHRALGVLQQNRQLSYYYELAAD